MKAAAILAAAAALWAHPALAQFSGCASIPNPAQRLECYDRQGTGTAPRAQAPAPVPAPRAYAQDQGVGGCSIQSPCTGPRGGRYYYTATGRKQYLPR